jgi:hypothetical protein
MGINVLPVASGGGIKQVQRGSAVGAGTVTISAVDINKSFVNIFGTASSGTVAATGALSAANGTASAFNGTTGAPTGSASAFAISVPAANINHVGVNGGTTSRGSFDTGDFIGKVAAHTANAAAQNISLNAVNIGLNAQNIALNAQNISGGSNNLVAAVVQGYLSGSTSLVVSGPCRWEVVEFA